MIAPTASTRLVLPVLVAATALGLGYHQFRRLLAKHGLRG